MATGGEGVFLYNTLTPLGDESVGHGEDEYISLDGSFLPLESAGSPVAEQATSTVTVERQEAKFSRNAYQKTSGSTEGRSLQSLIDAESDLLAEASTPEFKGRPVPSGSAGLGVLSTVNAFSVSRTSIQSAGSAQVEQDVEESEFISLDVGDDNIESVVQETVSIKEKRAEVPEDYNTTPKEVPPWARGRDAWIQSPLLQLHQEIVDFCEFVAPTEEEQYMRDTAVERVSAVVKSIWPSCQVKVFGSFATGLYLPTSDVDVVVLNSGCQALQDGLKALAKALTRGHVGKSIQVIGKARVPIIKFVETTSNIPFDISFDVANGPEAADFIKTAMSVIPPLRPLCLVLKIFLQQRELNEVYQGGIGSYALLVMLLTHLQMHPSKRRASNRGQGPPLETNLGILLVDFLDLYGRTLNMKDVGVSCRGGGRFFPKRDRGFNDHKRPFLLCVEDPQSPDNDIGKNSYAIQKVRSAFMMAHRLLTNLTGDNEVGLLSRIVRMDAKLVGRKVPVLPPKSQSVPAKRPHPVTFAGYYHEPNPDAGEDKYVVGDGTFSNSESDDALGFKTSDRRRRGRWQDYEEEDFPRGESADGYLAKKAKRVKRYKGVHDKDPYTTPQFAYDRYNDGSSTPQETGGEYSRKRHRGEDHQSSRGKDTPKNKKSTLNATESSGPEEGEVRLSRRARKREKIEKAERDAREKLEREGNNLSDEVRNGEETVKAAKSVGRGNGHNQHTQWNEDDVESSRSSKKHSRFKELAGRRGNDSNGGSRVEASESTRRIVVTKPAHKKIKYV
ncbi:hypothetical protein M758_3G038500 [Ceratodon purpureus]|nr:hypothetical protein M758_3G038500 [Ceratodon purpureus]